MFTTTVSLRPEMHRPLKPIAADEGVTMRESIRKGLEAYLAQYDQQKGGIHAKA